METAKESGHLSEKSIDSAVAEIDKYGMKAHFYFAGVVNREDSDLSYALDMLEAAGFIVTDSNGQLVRKVATKDTGSSESVEQRRAEFKIVK